MPGKRGGDQDLTESAVHTRPNKNKRLANVLGKRSYPNRGEKSVSVKNVESIFSTNFPFSSDLAFTLFHFGSSWKAFQFAAAASRLGCSRM